MILHADYTDLAQDKNRVQALALEILTTGYTALPHFLAPHIWEELQACTSDRSLGNKKNDALQGTVVERIGMSDEIIELTQALYNARCEITGEPRVTITKDMQRVGIPYKDAREGRSTDETQYHFDGAYANLLLAVVIPDDQSAGDGNLIMFPNIRRKYSSIVSKFLCRLLLHSKLMRRVYGYSEVVYKPGTLYFFFGDLSFHGVEPISNGERLVVTINSHW